MMKMGPMLRERVDESTQAAIVEVCQRWGIRRLALFGSVLRSDFTSDSDVDILVEFEASATPGFDFMTIQSELSGILGRRVDLHTPASLSKYYRQEVLREAETLYDAA
jgi:predicted nucleotidyltransferase